jgi:tRNA/rRNA methyltransferase
VIDLVPKAEDEAAARLRVDKRTWLEAHEYRVVDVRAAEAERDVAKVLDELAGVVSAL